MEDENKVETETTENTEHVDTETTETSEEESVEELKSRLAKAEEVANNQKIRAEKAERLAKEGKKDEVKVDGLTTKDTIAIMNAKVHEDDLDDVVDIAKLRKISVAEALKLDLVKTLLSTKAEQRKIAEVTNTSGSRRSATQVSDESLIESAREGKFPESDADIKRLLKAKMFPAKK